MQEDTNKPNNVTSAIDHASINKQHRHQAIQHCKTEDNNNDDDDDDDDDDDNDHDDNNQNNAICCCFAAVRQVNEMSVVCWIIVTVLTLLLLLLSLSLLLLRLLSHDPAGSRLFWAPRHVSQMALLHHRMNLIAVVHQSCMLQSESTACDAQELRAYNRHLMS